MTYFMFVSVVMLVEYLAVKTTAPCYPHSTKQWLDHGFRKYPNIYIFRVFLFERPFGKDAQEISNDLQPGAGRAVQVFRRVIRGWNDSGKVVKVVR